MAELETHLNRIREKFGTFNYAPPRMEFVPDHLINCEILFGSDITSKVPNYSGRKPGNTSSQESSVGRGDDGCDVDSSLDLRLHLNDEEMSPERHGGSESRNSSAGDGDGSLLCSEPGKQPRDSSSGQPIAARDVNQALKESHDASEQPDEHYIEETDPHEIDNGVMREKSLTVAEIEEKLRVTEARLRQSAGEGMPHLNEDSDGDDGTGRKNNSGYYS